MTSVYLGASPGACGWVGGHSVVARAHVNTTFHQRWPLSPSLMCLNQSGMWMNTPRASDIMEFPLLWSSRLRDSSFDISHRWLTRRGSPPTAPPDHRWMVNVERGHLIAQRSNLQQLMLSKSRGAWLHIMKSLWWNFKSFWCVSGLQIRIGCTVLEPFLNKISKMV